MPTSASGRRAGELVGVVDPPRSAPDLRARLDAFAADGILTGGDHVTEAVRFIRRPPLPRAMLPAYRIVFAGAVASLPADQRRMLGFRRSRLPVVWATGRALVGIGRLLGTRSPSEAAARARIARLGVEDARNPTT